MWGEIMKKCMKERQVGKTSELSDVKCTKYNLKLSSLLRLSAMIDL